MKYRAINPELFVNNRKRFMRKMQPESIAIFYSNDQMPRSGDTFYPFRQNAGLLYLSGLDQEETVVVLFPDSIREGFREIAFIRRTNDHLAVWEGPKFSKEEAQAVSGIEKVFWLDEMPNVLHDLFLQAKRIYLNTEEYERFIPPFPTRNMRFARLLMEQYPAHKYHRAQPILKKLMMTKSAFEIELIQQAIDITGNAFQRVLQFVRPGVMEYEIEAEITHAFLMHGANGHAYEPIVASGPNTCILHYIKNNRSCQDQELLLLDFGAEYGNYTSDLTRTIPVNGRFTNRQKAVYNAVHRILEEAKPLLVPGTTLEDYQKEVAKMVESALIDLKVLSAKDIQQQPADMPAYKKYFMHGVSHHLGLSVHDLSDRHAPIQEGMVFTCEPGIYLREEGIGVRLENNILVTDHGPLDLMSHIPIEAGEIEERMQQAKVLL